MKINNKDFTVGKVVRITGEIIGEEEALLVMVRRLPKGLKGTTHEMMVASGAKFVFNNGEWKTDLHSHLVHITPIV